MRATLADCSTDGRQGCRHINTKRPNCPIKNILKYSPMQRLETREQGEAELPFVVKHNCEWDVRLSPGDDRISQMRQGQEHGASVHSPDGSPHCRQPVADHEKTPPKRGFQAGRSEMIRTSDPHVPNVVRYQAALHSVTSGASIDQRFCEYKRGRDKITTERRIFSAQEGKTPAFKGFYRSAPGPGHAADSLGYSHRFRPAEHFILPCRCADASDRKFTVCDLCGQFPLEIFADKGRLGTRDRQRA